ncbi:12218_t:CDS:1, partial [Gigaspora rosea]
MSTAKIGDCNSGWVSDSAVDFNSGGLVVLAASELVILMLGWCNVCFYADFHSGNIK